MLPSFLVVLIELTRVLPKRHKIQILFCILLTVISGLLEVFFLSAVYSVFTTATASDRSLLIPESLADSLGITHTTTITLVLLLILLTLVRLLGSKISYATSASIGTKLSDMCITSYLQLTDHRDFRIRDDNEHYIDTVTRKIYFTVWTLNFAIIAINSLVVLLIVFTYLLLLNPLVFSLAVLPLALIYWLISLTLKNKIILNGDKISDLSENQLTLASSIVKGARELKIFHLDSLFKANLASVDRELRSSQAINNFLSSSPRSIIECAAFLVIIGVFLINSSHTSIIGLLGTFVLALQRCLPMLQQFYSSITDIRTYKSSAYEVIKLASFKVVNKKRDDESYNNPKQIPPLTEMPNYSIKCNLISFSYHGQENLEIIKEFKYQLFPGNFYELRGASGTGKSTLANLLLGFIAPTKGSVEHIWNENVVFSSGIHQKSLDLTNHPSLSNNQIPPYALYSEVSQAPVFFSGSCLSNIVSDSKPNYRKNDLIEIARELDILHILEKNINSVSGGQKQRVAIARCLYKNALVYLFDEATNALDYSTENRIMKFISHYLSTRLVLIVSHNPSNSIFCNHTIQL